MPANASYQERILGKRCRDSSMKGCIRKRLTITAPVEAFVSTRSGALLRGILVPVPAGGVILANKRTVCVAQGAQELLRGFLSCAAALDSSARGDSLLRRRGCGSNCCLSASATYGSTTVKQASKQKRQDPDSATLLSAGKGGPVLVISRRVPERTEPKQ